MTRHPVLSLDDLPGEILIQAGDQSAVDRGEFFRLREQRVAAFEREYSSNLLRSYLGDVSQAARQAQLLRGTLYRLLKKYDLNPQDFRH